MLKKLKEKLLNLFKYKDITEGDPVRGKGDSDLKTGILNDENFLDGIKGFLNTPISELMTPRIDVFAFEVSSTISDILPLIVQKEFTKYPVFERDIDHVVGILIQSDILRYVIKGILSIPIKEIMRQPFFVPETKNAFQLLKEFNETNKSIAIVIDEYGGTSGIVTVSDIVKKFISEIKPGDYFNRSEIQQIPEDGLAVDGKMHLEDLQDLLNTEFPEGDYDTIAGFLSHIAGKIPSEGEELRFGHLIFRIEKADKRRVIKVRIRKEKPFPKELH